MQSHPARHYTSFMIFEDDADVHQESQAVSSYRPIDALDSQAGYLRPAIYTSSLVFPNSQEVPVSHDLDNVNPVSYFSSFGTTATEILPFPLRINKALPNQFVR